MKEHNPNIKIARDFFEESYLEHGLGAQRRYPNEELLRFMGRHFFKLPLDQRKKIKALEVGCGSCSNLWMMAKEGLECTGIDLSEEALKIGKQMLDSWGVTAKLEHASMTDLHFESATFDVVCDVFSGFCLNMEDFKKMVSECSRVLKPGGLFFIYTPSTVDSTAFTNYAPAEKIDELTLNGIHRKDSPYWGQIFPFRFSEPDWMKKVLSEAGFKVSSCELTSRTYRNGAEKFSFLSVEAIKI